MDATLGELERVQRTLGTLLQIAQADAHARELALEDVDLANLAREIVDLYQPEASCPWSDVSRSAGWTTRTLRGNRSCWRRRW